MNQFLNEEQLRKVLAAAKNCRMEQLEAKFASLKEYVETAEEKESLINRMEGLTPGEAKPMLGRYDDVSVLQLGRAQDRFYEWGFLDCLHLIRSLLCEMIEEKS